MPQYVFNTVVVDGATQLIYENTTGSDQKVLVRSWESASPDNILILRFIPNSVTSSTEEFVVGTVNYSKTAAPGNKIYAVLNSSPALTDREITLQLITWDSN